jgi:hypothetical protein
MAIFFEWRDLCLGRSTSLNGIIRIAIEIILTGRDLRKGAPHPHVAGIVLRAILGRVGLFDMNKIAFSQITGFFFEN